MTEGAARTSLKELLLLFLRLGATAFGGPAAHIAMMQVEVVQKRRWLSQAEFLDLLSASNLIPGPNSTELAIHIGWARRRWAGLVVAGLAFIVPATLITALCGYLYVRFGTLPSVGWLLYGVKPVILAIVVQAIWSLAPKAAKSTPLRVLGACAALWVALGGHELLVLLAAGLAAWLLDRRARARAGGEQLQQAVLLAPLAGAPILASKVTLPGLFWVFFKVSSVLYGSGYVLLALLRADLVQRLGWLTEAQLIDAIAVGQITPGPVFTTATFVGYVLAGPVGAVVATVGIFVPAFAFVALSGPLVPKLRASKAAGAFLDGVNVASLALMGVVTLQLGRAALVDGPAFVIGAAAALVLVRWQVNATWVIGVGALVGWMVR